MNFLVMDLETSGLDTKTCDVSIMGAYDPQLDKFFLWKWSDRAKEKTIDLFNQYDCVLTFNGDGFDWPILERLGVTKFSLKVDVMKLYRCRGTLMRYGGFKSHRLTSLANDMELVQEHGDKGDIDYKLFQRSNWTREEQQLIIEYCKQDLKLTWLLWQKLVEHFDVLKEWISEEDALKFKHVTTFPGSYVYKALCHATGLPEVYPEDFDAPRLKFEGAFVSDPKVEVARVVR